MTFVKSKKVLEYLYQYALQKGTTEIIEAVVPYGKVGVILWEVANGIYDVVCSASDEDRHAILSEIQGLNEQEIEQHLNALAQDQNMINPLDISLDERKQVARGIYQSLRQIPNQRVNPSQVVNSINRSIFRGNQVLSVQNVHIASQSLGGAVVKTLMNGNQRIQRSLVRINQSYPKIEGFEIKGLLGEGAYAKVYLANTRLGQGQEIVCALKVGLLDHSDSVDREVLHMKAIKHKNVLNCWDSGIFEEHGLKYYWISMPNMGGITLENLILGASLDMETKLLILMQIAEGLSALHSNAIVHRDLKPSNCLISNDFEIKISDFGLSKDLNKDIASTRSKTADAIGTTAYMSPEQIEGKNIGFQADVWSFGMIAYEMFKGDLPWGREINALVMTGNIRHEDIDVVSGLRNSGVSDQLLKVIATCLKRDRSQRYSSGVKLMEAVVPVMKEDRKRIRHNRFRDSWRILIEKNLIEKFVMDQLQQGIDVFKIDAFLSVPEVYQISLILDIERLSTVLEEMSKVSRELQLKVILGKQVGERQKEDLLGEIQRRKDLALSEIEADVGRELQGVPSGEIARKLEEVYERQRSRKKIVEERELAEKESVESMIAGAQGELERGIEGLKERLRGELYWELKDFDQMKKEKLERERVERERVERERRDVLENLRVRKRNMLVGGGVLLLLVCGYLWNEEKVAAEKAAVLKAVAEKVAAEKAAVVKATIDFIKIEGGSFMMGSEDGSSTEKPMHRVEIGGFSMSKTEVTVGQYRKCVEASVCSKPDSCNWTDERGDKENHPINCVDWRQAREFAKWVGGDLPSEAQWEYASRSQGRDIKYPWGNNDPTCEIANFNRDCHGGTTVVCSKTGGNTAQGMCDMGGNVREWVLDEWHRSYENAPSNDIGWCSDRGCDSNTSALRVFHGGGWRYSASDLRSVARRSDSPDFRDDTLGFRVAIPCPP